MRNTPGSVVFAANYSHLFNLFGEADGKNQPRREIKWVPQSLGKVKEPQPEGHHGGNGVHFGNCPFRRRKKTGQKY